VIDSIRQLVHGYEHGHRLLAGGSPTSREDADLITRLSDLSGGMVPGESLSPYVTAYPLPSGTYYAVAKTWPDRDAPRAGCVLTHTLLVPMAMLTSANDLMPVASLLRHPKRDGSLRSLPAERRPRIDVVGEPGVDDFIAKFFGEGIRPLVWFAASESEALLWRVLSALWPAMRANFACCTFALQPRTLDDRPFDLMFAPAGARSRFAEYLGAHEVSAVPERKIEPWAATWKSYLLGSANEEHSEIRELRLGLDDNPNAIRKVFLFSELRERASTAPLAAIGALDILESLGTPTRANGRISDLVKRAIAGTENAPPDWALEVLCLVGLRLDRVDASAVDRETEGLLEESVRRCAERVPIVAVQLAERLATRDVGKLPRSFVVGLSDTFVRSDDRNVLANLAAAPQLGLNILEVLPETATKLLDSGRRVGMPWGDVLASWYGGIRDPEKRRALRFALIPEMKHAEDAPLLVELLGDLQPPEVAAVLSRTRHHAVAVELGRAFMELVGERFPAETHATAAALRFEPQSAAAYVVAGAFPVTAAGVDAAIALENCGGFVLAAVVDRAFRRAPTKWLQPAAMVPAFWECLLNDIRDEYVAGVASRLVTTLGRSAIAAVPDAPDTVEFAPRAVQSHAIRELLTDHVMGMATNDDLRRWLRKEWCASLVRRDASILRTVLADALSSGVTHPAQTWLEAWRTLDVVSETIPDTAGSVLELCGLLLWRRPTPWPRDASDIWCRLLRRSVSDPARHEAACAQAIRYCFDNPKLPVGATVAETFFSVHQAAVRDQARPGWDFFGWTSWDKGGELRRRLVDAFVASDWEPHWFVAAACEPWLLRKLCKRMLRQWKGEAFLERALEQLRQLVPPRTKLTHELAAILRDPDYEVDWD
jgi:hypothetical protein